MNAYINAQKGFFAVNGKSIAITEEHIQKLLDFTLSKLPVKDRQTLADNLETEKDLMLESVPAWVEALQSLSFNVEKLTKLTYAVNKDGSFFTADETAKLAEIASRHGLEENTDLMIYKKESVTIGGNTFDVSIPVTIAYRKKQERQARGSKSE